MRKYQRSVNAFFLGCLYLIIVTACGSDTDKMTPAINDDDEVTPASFSLPPLSSGDSAFTSENFSGSENCRLCHDEITNIDSQDLSIVTDWSSTMMANATRDPFWIAKVRSELNRNPNLSALINEKCTRCHAPMANEEIRRGGGSITVFDNGILNLENSRHNEAMDGVSCTLCHQIPDSPSLGTPEGSSGRFAINETKTIYGPYDNLVSQPMINNTGFTPVYSAHVKESELCASCHELKTPYVDESGNLLSQTYEDEFPEQMPYSEWLNSDYVRQQSCQGCHMSRTDGVVIATRPPWLNTRRDDFAVHDFIGANKMMLDILDTNRSQLGVRSNNFAETIAKTESMLASAATIEQVQSSLIDGVLSFTLKINSTTGHKLPTAYPSRRMVLHVTVRDSSGNIFFESGRPNDNGSVQALDSDSNLLSYEPHYDLITDPDQVQVYEAIMADNHDKVTYTLLRSTRYLKDNRILPIGFDKNSASNDIAVQGAAMSDNNFVGGSDQISYRINALATEKYTVNVELLYQTIAYAFAKDLFQDPSAEVNDFKMMYNASEFKFVPMTTLQFDVQQ